MFLLLLSPASSASAMGGSLLLSSSFGYSCTHSTLDGDRAACGEQGVLHFHTSYCWLPCTVCVMLPCPKHLVQQGVKRGLWLWGPPVHTGRKAWESPAQKLPEPEPETREQNWLVLDNGTCLKLAVPIRCGLLSWKSALFLLLFCIFCHQMPLIWLNFLGFLHCGLQCHKLLEKVG